MAFPIPNGPPLTPMNRPPKPSPTGIIGWRGLLLLSYARLPKAHVAFHTLQIRLVQDLPEEERSEPKLNFGSPRSTPSKHG